MNVVSSGLPLKKQSEPLFGSSAFRPWNKALLKIDAAKSVHETLQAVDTDKTAKSRKGRVKRCSRFCDYLCFFDVAICDLAVMI